MPAVWADKGQKPFLLFGFSIIFGLPSAPPRGNDKITAERGKKQNNSAALSAAAALSTGRAPKRLYKKRLSLYNSAFPQQPSVLLMPHFPPALYAEKLLSWYGRHLRLLPWRITPQQQAAGAKAEAYRVWLSEVMLQQTTVAAVKPYFAKFIAAWPNLAALAAAEQDDVLKAWAGLGYYSRARNLKACADKIMADYGGEFPQTAAELRHLPGIGAYTAAAIAAIAFDEACAVVDANVERVIARLFCLETPLPQARAEIRALCQNITPLKRAGDFAQAMMDLGATLCSVKKPACGQCPLAALCLARQNSSAASLPRKAPKQKRPEHSGAAFIALSDKGAVYLQKRPERGLLGGMSEAPNYFEQSEEAAGEEADLRRAPFAAKWRYQGKITHIFTHFRLTLAVYKAENIAESAPHLQAEKTEAGFWVRAEDLPGEALPTVMKKAIAAALPHSFRPIKPPAEK